MKRSDEIASICAALAGFTADVTNPAQTKTATVPTKAGGQYTYTYADLGDVLSHVRPALGKHGLSLIQELDAQPDHVGVTTVILHESGQYLAFPPLCLPAPEGATPQAYGGVITYARRYSLMAALGLAADSDDDAVAASGRGAPAASQRSSAGSTRGAQAKPATEKQLGKLRAVATEAGVSEEQLHKAARRDFKVEDLKELTTKQASELIDRIGKLPAKEHEAEPEPPAEPEDEEKDFWPEDEEAPGMDAEQARKSWEKPAKAQENLL